MNYTLAMTLMTLCLKRLGALFYDSVIILLLLLLVTTFAVALFPTEPLHQNLLFRLTLLFSWFSIVILCWLLRSQTLGMRAWQLKLETIHGKPLRFKDCLIRFIVAFPSLLFFGIGLFWLLFDKQHLALHDRLSKTKIVSYKN